MGVQRVEDSFKLRPKALGLLGSDGWAPPYLSVERFESRWRWRGATTWQVGHRKVFVSNLLKAFESFRDL